MTENVAENAKDQVAETGALEAEAASAHEDLSLDDLLKEYDQQTKEPAKTEEPKEDVKELLGFVRRQMEDQSRKQVQDDLNKAASLMKENGLNLPDDVLKAVLNWKAQNDSRIFNAWKMRHDSPEQFSKVVKSIAKELAKNMGDPVHKGVTDSVEAMVSAVQSTKTKTHDSEDPPDFLSMSKKELEKFRQALR